MSKRTTQRKFRSAYQWGKDHGSCALAWRGTLGPDATQADAHRLCARGDWLIWQLSKLPEDEFDLIRPQLEKAIEKIVTRAVKNHALNCGIDLVEKWARDWLDNTDRSARAAKAAKAAGSAGGMDENKLQADDIREFIPQWPGSC